MSTTSFPCPHCGMAYSLGPEYLAQYGGQATTCTRCQRQFVLPTAAQAPAAAPALGGPPPTTQQQQQGPAPVLAYRGPGIDPHAPVYGVWREGSRLVAIKGAALPYRCVKCNGQPEGPPMRRTFSWHPPVLYLILLAGILVYAIVALVIQQTGTLDVALCREHRKRRLNGMLGGWGTFFAGIACFVLAGVFENGWLMIPGFLLFLGGLVWVYLVQRILSPSRIDTHYLWMNGVCEEFLHGLPPVPALGYGGFGHYGPPPAVPYGGYPNHPGPYAPQGQPPPQQFTPPR